jgi:hypothetical protein
MGADDYSAFGVDLLGKREFDVQSPINDFIERVPQ